jgi:glutamate-5-semialdehyde dehydrogenase
MTVQSLLELAKAASGSMAQASTSQKNLALAEVANLLRARSGEILAANSEDLARGERDGLATNLQDRLRLTAERVEALASALGEVIALPDPIGENLEGRTLPNGLKLSRIRVPLGVIGAIYEARPNVTIDIAALAIKSGNCAVLRGGSAAESSNAVLVSILRDGLQSAGLNPEAVQTIDSFGREGAVELMRARGLVDVLIPRGSATLISTVVEESKVPTIETGDGVVHMFLDASASLEMSLPLVDNSKTQRISVCNSLETLLVHRDAAARLLPAIGEALIAKGVTLHGCEATRALIPAAVPATEADWEAEYLSMDLAVRVVDSLDAALEHIAKYSTHHTESIVTEHLANAERFLAEVDSSTVMVNASTRFTDGGEFGMGAEVGIATQKLHARGPMGLRDLTSTKWLVRGTGQVRG